MRKKSVMHIVLMLILCLVSSFVLCGCGNKCPVEGCKNDVFYSEEDANENTRAGWLIYCSEHACNVKDCEEPTNGKASYCKKHKCKYCSDGKIEGKDVCEWHGHCQHRLYDAYGCENEPIGDTAVCAEHKCVIEGCTEGFGFSDSQKYCSDHECKDVDCPNVAVKAGRYCTAHGCHICGDRKYEDYNTCYECLDDAAKSKEWNEHESTKATETNEPTYSYDDDNDSSVDTNTCKSCKRKFPAGDSGKNYMKIAKTGMCNSCYNSYKSMEEYVD